MILTLVETQSLSRTALPEIADGQIDICDQMGEQVFRVLGRSGAWCLSACGKCLLVDPMPEKLTDGLILRLRWKGRGAILLAQDNRAAGKYTRLCVPEVMDITVGSAKDNSIIYSAPMIEQRHLTLQHRRKTWLLRATGAVYVNGKRVREKELQPGDAVWVMGLTLIPFAGGLAMNRPSQMLSFGTWKPIRIEAGAERAYLYEAPELTWFSRMPRFRKHVEAAQLNVALPPSMAAEPQVQSPLSISPALTSGLFMMLSGIGSVASLGMIAGNVALPLWGRKKAQQQHDLNEQKRQQAYNDYLAQTEQALRQCMDENQRQLRELSPDPAVMAAELMRDTRHLWERRLKDDDFLAVRLGTGNIPLQCNVQLPPPVPGEVQDPLKKSLKDFLDKDWLLKNVPIVFALGQYQVVGIAGSPSMRAQMQTRILAQLALHAAYDELRLCILGMPEKNVQPFMRLPHLWNKERTLRYVAAYEDEISNLIPALEQEIAVRQNDLEQVGKLVVLIADGAIARRYAIESLLLERKLSHVHVLVFAGHSHELPSSCGALIGIKEDQGVLRLSEGGETDRIEFKTDNAQMPPADRIVQLLENTRLEQSDTAQRLPDVVPFLELFNVKEPEALNIVARWRRNAAAPTLAVPLGKDEDGQLCMLDIQDQGRGGQGPHGLIAGTTGSGKSELLMTYILALAVNFSPNEVAFALIDYKGGGMANAFAGLPHLAGAVSNLDGSTITRCMMSIRSELNRRQALFAKAKVNEISRYQRYFAEGQLKEPLPHLLIIVDEFAQLKANEPEFLRELINVAQIGRSLGVHLILSTQKPSGVVDDQIWGNSNFRICLRVQNAQDSQEMLHKPDAAALKGVGRFLIQYEDVLIRAQSAWTGAPLKWDDDAIPDCEAEILDALGRTQFRAALPTHNRPKDGETQLSAVLNLIREAGDALHMRTHLLWMPPLEDKLALDVLRSRYPAVPQPYELKALLGEIDVPEAQMRRPLLLSLNAGCNTIVYGAHGSGKRMLLETLLDDLLNRHSVQELTIYLLDLSGDGFLPYAAAPQVGDVITMDEEEKLQSLLRLLERELVSRRKIMPMQENDIHVRLQKAGVPNILVILHPLNTFCEWAEPQRDRLLTLLGDGARYGIHFLATSAMSGGISMRIVQQFSQILVLQMASRDDYAMLLGNTKGMMPGNARGRGLIRMDSLLEFQLAGVQESGADMCRRLAQSWTGQQAQPVPVMPESIGAKEMEERMQRMKKPLRLPVGIYQDNLSTAYLSADKHGVFRIVGSGDDVKRFLLEWTACISRAMEVVVLDGSGEYLSADNVRHVKPNEWGSCVEGLLRERLAEQELEEERPLPERLKLVILTDVQEVWNRLQRDPCSSGEPADDLLAALLMKVKPNWRIRFVLCGDTLAFEKVKPMEWYRKAVCSSDAVFLGEGFKYQYVVECGKKPVGEEEPFPMGYVISNGAARSAKMVSTFTEDTQEEEEW